MSEVKNMIDAIAKCVDIRSRIEDFVESAVEYDTFRSDLIKLELDGTIGQKELVDRAFITGVYTTLRLCALDRMREFGCTNIDFFVEGGGASALPIKEKENEAES